MKKLSKREASISYMKENQSLFQCPICKNNMTVNDHGNVKCPNSHLFDIAKQGYINFMTKPVHSMYSKELFEARKEIIHSGLYEKIQKKIAELVGLDATTILDTGCGEGSHLVKICEELSTKIVAVGIDIAKEGIISAAKNYEQKIWCVGDLANSPFKEKSFDCILNFLSPANYDEFKRLLKPNGILIKVVPQTGYLQELRKQAFNQSEKEHYTNVQTVELFFEQFTTVNIERMTYTIPIEKEMVSQLVDMTPLGWHMESIEISSIKEITIDLDILVGKM